MGREYPKEKGRVFLDIYKDIEETNTYQLSFFTEKLLNSDL